MRRKIKAAVFVTAIIAVPAFAAPFDVSTLAGTVDLVAIVTQAETDYANAAGGPVYDQNVTLVGQTGNGMNTAVDQSNGIGNFIAIIQDASNHNNPGVAYASQAGNGNFAVIYQH